MGATIGYLVGFRPAVNLPITISVYFAGGDAAGAYLPLETQGDAVATSDKTAIMPNDVIIQDFLTGPATGVISVKVDGQEISTSLNCAAYAVTNAGRKFMPIRVRKGSKIQVRVVSACAA